VQDNLRSAIGLCATTSLSPLSLSLATLSLYLSPLCLCLYTPISYSATDAHLNDLSELQQVLFLVLQDVQYILPTVRAARDINLVANSPTYGTGSTDYMVTQPCFYVILIIFRIYCRAKLASMPIILYCNKL